ncbi:MAG: glucoamylase family protein, partial [Bacteriovorax sp.]
RRSLVPPFLLLWLYFALINSTAPILCTLAVLFILFLPAFVHTLYSLVHFSREVSLINHMRNIGNDFMIRMTQVGLSIVFLPHQTYINMDAILRTLYRLLVSKRNLLEWTTAAEMESIILSKNLPSLNIILPTELFVLLTLASLIVVKNAESYLAAFPFLLMWFLFPPISQYISRIKQYKDYVLSKKDILETRLLARRTWHFFETFVTEVDHWLAPDNFQEDPRPVVAHRTSPTNMGVLLLSTSSAYDFGYLGSLELIERLEKTQETLEKLEKYNGHFYNWYDTTTLAPLYPIYISTVDSGNLAAHLITMKNFCLNLDRTPIVERQILSGLQDTLLVIKEELVHVSPRYLISPLVAKHQAKNEFQALLGNLIEKNAKSDPKTFFEWIHYCEEMKSAIDVFSDILAALELEHGERHFKEVTYWTACTVNMIHKLHFQLTAFAPFSEAKFQHLHSKLKSFLPNEEKQINEFAEELKSQFDKIQLAKDMPAFCHKKMELFKQWLNFVQKKFPHSKLPSELDVLFKEISMSMQSSLDFSHDYLSRFQALAKRYDDMAMSFDFKFLFNKERKIFAIGYNLTEGKMDNSYYDLLASEARLASFFAIAKGDVPLGHWFHLGRQMSSTHGHRALVSWSASMFEYLMPLLIMRNYANTLLYQTYHSVVARQIAYTSTMGLPWGVSESGYNARDLLQFYQYGPFGIPGMGLKYGLASDIVISPYSSALAAMINPRAALENFKELKKENAYAKFGFYESIDYTKERLQKGHKNSIIKSFMVHHQGMVLISLNNVLHNNIMQTRFHADPIIKATELLLQERIPHHMAIIPHHQEEMPLIASKKEDASTNGRHFKNVNTLFPHAHILSNGHYTVMAGVTGAGFSRYQDIAVSRWTEDSTLDSKGSFFYLRDHFENSVSSATYQPLKENADSYECSFSEHKIEFFKRDPNLSVHTEIIVSPEDNVELRRITISNNSVHARNIDVTSFLEPVMARPQDDIAHLTFSKLFLETEYIPSKNALLIHRRKRSHGDKERWGIHVVVSSGNEYSATEYETDRMRFIGRGRTPSNPLVIMENLNLSNTTGTVLDPILSLRKCLRLEPRSKAKVCFTTGVAESRAEALRLIDQYNDIHSFDREQELSWTQTQAELRHLRIQHKEVHLFQELASAILYSN